MTGKEKLAALRDLVAQGMKPAAAVAELKKQGETVGPETLAALTGKKAGAKKKAKPAAGIGVLPLALGAAAIWWFFIRKKRA